jgi:hypothetical protein
MQAILKKASEGAIDLDAMLGTSAGRRLGGIIGKDDHLHR